MSNRTRDTRSLNEIFKSIYATLGFDYKADEQRRIRILMELAHHGVMVHDDWVYDTNYLHDKLSMVVQTNRMMGQRVLHYADATIGRSEYQRKREAELLMGSPSYLGWLNPFEEPELPKRMEHPASWWVDQAEKIEDSQKDIPIKGRRNLWTSWK